jgi:ABC-type polysaccharide/polyol phosphate transport system ATPase subunit
MAVLSLADAHRLRSMALPSPQPSRSAGERLNLIGRNGAGKSRC